MLEINGLRVISVMQMDKHFYKELFSRLQQEARAAVPVMDPTQGRLMVFKIITGIMDSTVSTVFCAFISSHSVTIGNRYKLTQRHVSSIVQRW